jgi:exodeoxyribonuclease VII large subunit
MIHLTVSEINAYLREMLDADEAIRDIWVEGEISNFSRASSGHCYFSLKEGGAVIRAAMWRTYAGRLATLPRDGDAVLAHGRVSFYEPRGELQLYVDMIRPAGEGLLYARLEELKARLSAEGLFDASRKRTLPPLPRRIGVVTSPTGAALQDILAVLSRRYPLVEVLLSGCQVQGTEAPASIVRALELLYACAADIDLIILARGGGSIEDLWSFNEERVARAVFASPVPLIAGVGHESDTTLVDDVADIRAPTPSAAAELAVPDAAELALAAAALRQRLDVLVVQASTTRRSQVEQAEGAIQRHNPLTRIALARQQIDDMVRRASRQMEYAVALRSAELKQRQAQLDALNPHATLRRGYALVQRADDGTTVVQAGQVAPGDALHVTLQDGTLVVDVREQSSSGDSNEKNEG